MIIQGCNYLDIFLTLVMFCARSALTATYSLDFSLVLNMVSDYVNLDIVFVIGFEVTLAALEAFLIEMYSFLVISHSLDIVSLEFTDIASYYF